MKDFTGIFLILWTPGDTAHQIVVFRSMMHFRSCSLAALVSLLHNLPLGPDLSGYPACFDIPPQVKEKCHVIYAVTIHFTFSIKAGYI